MVMLGESVGLIADILQELSDRRVGRQLQRGGTTLEIDVLLAFGQSRDSRMSRHDVRLTFGDAPDELRRRRKHLVAREDRHDRIGVVLQQEERRQASAEGRSSYDLLTGMAGSVPPGSDKLLFLPWAWWVGLTAFGLDAHLRASGLQPRSP